MKFYFGEITNPVDTTVESVVETSNYFLRWWNSIDWNTLVSELVSKSIYFLISIVLYLAISKAAKSFLKRTFRKPGKYGGSINRRNTVYKMVDNAVSYILTFFLIYSLLSIIGIPVSTLLAGAGIAGIAIGLGAQSFISDIVTGFFILLENQADVGDSVTIGSISGKVVSIGLRSTQIKGFDGTHHFLPNHTIQVISNSSRNDMRAMIELTFYPETDFVKVRKVLEQVNDQNVPLHTEITQGPTYAGPVNVGSGLMAFRVTFYALNGQQFMVHDTFLTLYLDALKKEGITLPKDPFFKM